MDFKELLEEMPVIAAVKSDEELALACQSECKIVFVLYSDICKIGSIVAQIKQADKIAVVHLDLIEGLENKPVAVRYIHQNTGADGIISTKPMLIKTAKEAGLLAIQRVFMIDSIAFKNMKKHLSQGHADMIEVLPGVMPKMLTRIVKEVNVPVIAGGLIVDKQDVIAALGSGAIAVSTTLPEIWQA